VLRDEVAALRGLDLGWRNDDYDYRAQSRAAPDRAAIVFIRRCGNAELDVGERRNEKPAGSVGDARVSVSRYCVNQILAEAVRFDAKKKNLVKLSTYLKPLNSSCTLHLYQSMYQPEDNN
jgi:hypothetical protein